MILDPSAPAQISDVRAGRQASYGGVAIADYSPANGDHLCSLWTDPATDRRSGHRYLRGAGYGEAALAILDSSRDSIPAAAGHRAALERDGVTVFSTDQVHVEGRYFDPERMRRFWVTRSGRTRADGFRHMRAVAEMAWEMRGLPGSDEAPEFESSLNPLFSSLPASVICQYGAAGFSARTVLAMILAHPLVVIGATVFSNPFHAGHNQFAERFEALRRDPVGALLPIWAHFLSAHVSLEALARYLCNSVPTLTAADGVWVALSGLPAALALEVARDEVEPADEVRWQRLRTASRQSRPIGDGSWGTVRAVEVDGLGVLTACLDQDRHRIIATRNGWFSEPDQFRFVLLAWDVATALRRLPSSAPNK